ncbi:ZIP family metal transporter [Thalassoglobus polymorphus]|uniref:Zinc transporter ZupT n=1 Tax=Thalassoglobus polymorphus TaxID=2527994 RepID=A0A517QUU6_9PLAN|nr:ZIP family metal transporter [Thalassoglobus polymorphus]QDT35406.1 zinc transporter ZupT [Thalassoglobus polymorphus]
MSSSSVAFAETPSAAKHDHHDHHDHSHGEHDHSESGTNADFGNNAFRQLGLYTFLIAGASLLGGWLPTRIRFSHLQFQRLLSVVGGMLLGIGVFHLFPHAVLELGVNHIDFIVTWMMGGIVMMFFLLRTFHVHHHEPPATTDLEETSLESISSEDDHDHHDSCQHDHGVGGGLSWAGMFFGLSIHTLLDGLALGASMQAEVHHATGGWLGLGVLAGIVLHKPLDSLSITTLMLNANQSPSRRVIVNLIYSLLCPLGAALFLWGVRLAGGETALVVGAGLAFSAGIFLCIALADLLPEMEFHTHNRWQLSVCLLVGIALAWGIRFLEPGHLHH